MAPISGTILTKKAEKGNLVNPNFAFDSATLTGPAARVAVTELPTAIISVPVFLKPRLPLSVTKSAILALKPVTSTAMVFAAIPSTKV